MSCEYLIREVPRPSSGALHGLDRIAISASLFQQVSHNSGVFSKISLPSIKTVTDLRLNISGIL